jgi:DNA-binding response OmpR family regulator
MGSAEEAGYPRSLTRPLILIVEDDPLIALEIAYILGEAGFDVLGPVARVLTGLELLKRVGCNGAVLDIHLGGETSEQIALKLAALGVPFVTLSGHSEEQRPPAFSSAPAVAKPVRAGILVAEIRRCMGLREL